MKRTTRNKTTSVNSKLFKNFKIACKCGSVNVEKVGYYSEWELDQHTALHCKDCGAEDRL